MFLEHFSSLDENIKGGEVQKICLLFQYLDILQHKCFVLLFSVFDESIKICHIHKICAVLRYPEICNITFFSSFKSDNDKCFWNILVVLMKILREVMCKRSAFFINVLSTKSCHVQKMYVLLRYLEICSITFSLFLKSVIGM